jgi:hypothetical protein
MSLILQSSGGGQITIQEPATASNFTQTLPAASGEVMVSGNQPAFSAYASATQTVSPTTQTKIIFDTERFDTNNNFASSRFQPSVAGYYQISANVCFGNNTTGDGSYLMIYKNSICVYFSSAAASDNTYSVPVVSTVIHMNGSTDFVEIYQYQSGAVSRTTILTVFGANDGVNFSGALVRAA